MHAHLKLLRIFVRYARGRLWPAFGFRWLLESDVVRPWLPTPKPLGKAGNNKSTAPLQATRGKSLQELVPPEAETPHPPNYLTKPPKTPNPEPPRLGRRSTLPGAGLRAAARAGRRRGSGGRATSELRSGRPLERAQLTSGALHCRAAAEARVRRGARMDESLRAASDTRLSHLAPKWQAATVIVHLCVYTSAMR